MEWFDLLYVGAGLLGGGFGVKFIEYLGARLGAEQSQVARLWSAIGELKADLKVMSAERDALAKLAAEQSLKIQALTDDVGDLKHEVNDLLRANGMPPKYPPPA